MRDSTVLEMHKATAKREALILGQFEFMETRMEAFEGVLLASGWRDRLRWAVQPLSLKEAVDAVQLILIRKRQEAMREARQRSKIQVVS